MRILVTGAAGFIGASLVRRIAASGHDVTALDRFSQGLPISQDGIRYEKGDITSTDIAPIFDGVETVFHLAARNSVRDCETDPEGARAINERGTENVFLCALESGVRKVIYASSAVLDHESTRSSIYAQTKATNEETAKKFAQKGLTTVGLRYYNAYGPGQSALGKSPGVIVRFIATVLKGERPVLFEGDDMNAKDFLYIDDINDFHDLCLKDARVDNRILSIGTGRSHSIKEVLEIVQKVAGTDLEPTVRPSDVVPTQMAADTGDVSALGWNAKVDLQEGIRQTVPYVRDELMRAGLI